MDQPRKINTEGASGPKERRTVRRPEYTQGRTTGQFTVPPEYRTKSRSSSYPDSAGQEARSTGGADATRGARPRQVSSTTASYPKTAPVRRIEQARQQSVHRGTAPAASSRSAAAVKRGPSALKITLITLLVIVLISIGALMIVMHAISPGAGSISISELINTPKEYQGDQINILVAGVDWEEGRAYGTNDSNTNDGMTDMILYVHFDLQNKKVSMLQIPRNTFVAGVYNSNNGQINNVALAGDGVADLADCINKMFGLTVDDYITIDMASLKEVVDTFGGLEVYVPRDMSYNGSVLQQGYQTLNGDAAEFFVRCRHGAGYERSDLDRLNMQRYFYSALFRRIRTATIWDIAKLTPAAMNYITTSLSAGQIASLGVSFLKVSSADILVCQLPVYNSPEYYLGTHSVVVAAREQSADLLNSYFRTYTGPVPANDLQLPEWSVVGEPSDPHVQYMGQLDTEAENAQDANNLDGSFTVKSETPAQQPQPSESEPEA